jgi:hypothetical protein
VTYFIAFRITREGKVLDASEIYCSEEEAKERARELATDTPVESWEGRNAWRGLNRPRG